MRVRCITGWTYLLVAALIEICRAIGLKYTQGFTKLRPSVLTIAAMVVSLFFLALAVRTIPVGTGYAIWTGIGEVGTATLGIILFAETVKAREFHENALGQVFDRVIAWGDALRALRQKRA